MMVENGTVNCTIVQATWSFTVHMPQCGFSSQYCGFYPHFVDFPATLWIFQSDAYIERGRHLVLN